MAVKQVNVKVKTIRFDIQVHSRFTQAHVYRGLNSLEKARQKHVSETQNKLQKTA